MRQEYIEELEKLKTRMEKAEQFAKKVPVFEKEIISKKLNEDDPHINFGSYIGKTYTGWDLYRRKFNSGNITNFCGSFDGSLYLTSVYLNTLTLYGLHGRFSLEKYLTPDLYFFFDDLNSTYYLEDPHVTPFAEKLLS